MSFRYCWETFVWAALVHNRQRAQLNNTPFQILIFLSNLLVCMQRKQCSGSAPFSSCAGSRSRHWSPWGWPSKHPRCLRWMPAAWPYQWSARPDSRYSPRCCQRVHCYLLCLALQDARLVALGEETKRQDKKRKKQKPKILFKKLNFVKNTDKLVTQNMNVGNKMSVTKARVRRSPGQRNQPLRVMNVRHSLTADQLKIFHFLWTHWWGWTLADCECQDQPQSPLPPPPGTACRGSGLSALWTTCFPPPSCWYKPVSGCDCCCPHTKPAENVSVMCFEGCI